jgi:hypothetical protein
LGELYIDIAKALEHVMALKRVADGLREVASRIVQCPVYRRILLARLGSAMRPMAALNCSSWRGTDTLGEFRAFDVAATMADHAA